LSDTDVISIVDDNESVREATKGLVRSLGYEAATFSSAEEFIQSEHIKGTWCLITDVQMPGMTGVDLQDYLIARGYRTPIVFITAYPERQIRDRALKAGAVGFLKKPFSDEQLIACLSAALGTETA
jgi:FixJ family two-component response regulator